MFIVLDNITENPASLSVMEECYWTTYKFDAGSEHRRCSKYAESDQRS